jgi:hypothetical protein
LPKPHNGAILPRGFDSTTVDENLAAGQWSALEVINAWINSPDDYANLINPQLTQVGLGLSGGPVGSDMFVLYWVADFGSSTQNFLEVSGTGAVPIDVRAVVAQLHSDLQMADAAVCPGNTSAVTSDLDQGFVNYWVDQNLLSYSALLSNQVGTCLESVLGFDASMSGANYSAASAYITANLME